MFYKRISDLHPLGIKGSDWNHLDPIPIGKGSYYKVEKFENGSYRYVTLDGQEAKPNEDLPIPALKTAFDQPYWYKDTQTPVQPYSYAVGTPDSPEDEAQLTSEYFAKSLWFEVAISKDKYNEPVSDYIDHYQSKRVNAYLLFQNISELHADRIDAPIISAENLSCTNITANRIFSTQVSSTSITADYGNISSLNSTSITVQAISASNLGSITQLSGTNMYYENAAFTNITVTGIANLTAEAAYWADVAEMYTADNSYLYGTLVKFGGVNEITVADDKANAVVSEKPAITLNSGNRDVYATPIVLTGRSKVRVIHPVKKFDKIYLSEIPGVGASEKYKISTATLPIGIALENKSFDEEGMVECILQLNFE